MIFFNDRRRNKPKSQPVENTFDDWGTGLSSSGSTRKNPTGKDLPHTDDWNMAPRNKSISEEANRGTRQAQTPDDGRRHGYNENDPEIVALRKNFPNLPDPLPPALVAERAKNKNYSYDPRKYRMERGDD